MSISSETIPSAHTPPGIWRQRRNERSGVALNQASSRRPRRRRREPAVEGVAFGRHVGEQLRYLEAVAEPLLEPLAQLDETFGPHHVDVGDGAAGERREAEAED